ncbi:GDP-mannose 4,6-dehydratase [Paenibacillus oenotherae]|uniref:GDP-mannose 4,6-dehydratase n=1 Tax=Paenibacillus oenotherae TaxID=1435645 RepID=A0ABS7D3M8_9BACL|nr:GDP-mannose 4,6-dehydratase [Paenibacillus oenotherae]
MRAVVTGGAGFIGSRLAASLLSAGYEVVVVDDLSSGSISNIPSGARFLSLNVNDGELPALLADMRPHLVYHLAEQADVSRSLFDPSADMTTNVIGTLRVLEGCRLASAKIILASTAAVFGKAGQRILDENTPESPVSSYGLSKRTAERYATWYWRMHGVPYTILRFANVYGPGQRARGDGGVVAVFLERMARGLPLVIHGKGNQVRDFVHVDDVVRACVNAASRAACETIHIGTGEAWSINAVAGELAKLHDAPLDIRHGDARPADVARSVFMPDKAARMLGWIPSIRFVDGLRSTYQSVFNRSDKDEDQAQP